MYLAAGHSHRSHFITSTTTREKKHSWSRTLKRIKADTLTAAASDQTEVAIVTSIGAIGVDFARADKVVALSVSERH